MNVQNSNDGQASLISITTGQSQLVDYSKAPTSKWQGGTADAFRKLFAFLPRLFVSVRNFRTKNIFWSAKDCQPGSAQDEQETLQNSLKLARTLMLKFF